MSALLTERMCDIAWDILVPSIKQAEHKGLINKFAGSIVVLDPTITYRPDLGPQILFSQNMVHDHPKWETYSQFAYAKAKVTWRTGRSTREMQQVPHLYQWPDSGHGDIKWGGSVVRDGLVVAFSGVQPEYDEWIAGMMADLLIAMCRRDMVTQIMADDNVDWLS